MSGYSIKAVDLKRLEFFSRALQAFLAVGCAALGLGLASQHPLWPTAMPTLWLLWAMVVVWRPQVWLWALPAALPVASFSPWSGWSVFEEFDLPVLATLSALHARHWFDKVCAGQSHLQSHSLDAARNDTLLMVALWLMTGIGLIIGYGRGEAGSAHFFASHQDSLWSVRATKGWVWALLLWPWVRAQMRQAPTQALHRVGQGMLMGLAMVVVVSINERLAYPGLWDFHSHYRTTALFWEMNVGGAAIDVYLAVATPFAAWALWQAYAKQSFLRWLLAGFFAALVTYTCLTTFARGVYMAVIASMLALTFAIYAQWSAQGGTRRWPRWLVALRGLKWPAQHRAWRLPATVVLATVLLLEVMVVLDGSSFMTQRIDDGPADLAHRITHWRHIVALLKTPENWALGLGAGRFAAEYAAASPARSFSGALSWSANAPALPPNAAPKPGAADQGSTRDGMALLQGPQHRAELGGLYSVTQRVPLASDGGYSVRLVARVAKASQLLVRVCEKHLLYDRNCQAVVLPLQSAGSQWVTVSSRLRGPRLDAGAWWAPKQGVFSVAVLKTEGSVELNRIELFDPQGRDVLRNGNFSGQLAHWFPSAQRYYLPWHTDNLLLELLVEHGVLGVLAFAALVACAVRALFQALGRTFPTPPSGGGSLVPVLIACIVGVLSVGLVSSVLDVPRLKFLVCFLLLLALALKDQPRAVAEAPK